MASLLVLACSLSACKGPASTEVRADVERYLVHIRRWAPTEAEVAGSIRRILATNFVDEAEVHRQIADARPRAKRQLLVLDAYRARTEDVRAIHRFYSEAWRELLGAYADVEAGLRNTDQARLAKGREGFLAWRTRMRQTARDLSDLAAAAGVSPEARMARDA